MPGTGSTTAISMTITTPRGPVHGQWWPANMTCAAAILLAGPTNAPADIPQSRFRLFDELAVRIQRAGIGALQLEQCGADLDERLICLLSALMALKRQGVERMALIGWHAGATLALTAASACDAVTGVAALAPSAAAANLTADIAPRRLLLMHGTADRVAPTTLSRLLYARASEPKEIVVYPDERHDFSVFHDEALDKLTSWTRGLLLSPFKPRGIRRASIDLLGSGGVRAREDSLVALSRR